MSKLFRGASTDASYQVIGSFGPAGSEEKNLIFFSETPQLNEVKLGRKHLKIAHFVPIH
jgi:hypothetical protein